MLSRQGSPERFGVLRSALFTLFIWGVLFALLEMGLRLYQRWRPAGPEWTDGQLFMCEPHPTRIWAYKPDFTQSFRSPEFTMSIRTNAWRLRGGPALEPAGSREYRILVIGDSFTFGWGVADDERYSDVLENELRRELRGRQVAVLNGGYWGYSFDQQYLLLKELLPRWRPRLVIQGLYPPHLLTLMSHRWQRGWDAGLAAVYNDGIRVERDGSLHFRNAYLDSPPFSSRVAAEVFRAWFNWRLSREATTGDLALLDARVHRYELAWRMGESVLKETAEYARRHGAEYMAFGIPRDVQVSEAEWHEDSRKRLEAGGLDLDLPNRRLGELARQAQADWVDLLPGLRRAYSGELYFPRDPHWTRQGHRLAAELLLPHVRARVTASLASER